MLLGAMGCILIYMDHDTERRNAVALSIVLVEPEIPPNTGNIARSCAATDTELHLIKPLGFRIDDRAVRRAGLDYWPYVDLTVHENLGDFMNKYQGKRRMFFASTKGGRLFTDVRFQDGDMLVFGKETAGLPRDLLSAHRQETIRIPMSRNTRLRSFNLADSANIILFEALRQLEFPGLK